MLSEKYVSIQQIGSGVYTGGTIRSIQMPPNWIPESHQSFALGQRSIAAYRPPDDDKTEICLFYRGLPMYSTESTTIFRAYLQLGDQVIFSETDKTHAYQYIDYQGRRALQAAVELSEVLGNASNNQLFDPDSKGLHIQLAEVMRVNGNPVLSIKGWYHDRETDLRGGEVWNIFIDGSPSDDLCAVLEVYVIAPGKELFDEYSAVFQTTLNSIEWQTT